ncbi:MAG: ABC transporter substrate-binding protein [Negativicutes bacterium]|nr:ABC transporter substrate-binding protein [Negativicutes bacterium]
MTRTKYPVAIFLAVLLVLGSLAGLTGCGTATGQKVIKIGVVGPESGSAAQLGQGQRKAVQMAVDEINAKKGAGDWKLEVLFEDDEGNPTKSASAANKLIQQSQVNVIIGAIHSSATLADMVVTGRAGIPQITAGSTGSSITEQGNKWIFRTAVNDEFQANALVKYAKDVLGLTKIATLTAADDYGQSGAKLLATAAEKQGLQLVTSPTYNNGDKDFKPQLLTIKDGGAQAIFMWGLYTEAALISKQARQLGINAQLFGASGMAAQKLIELGGDAAQGLILTQTFLPDSDSPQVMEFVGKYKGKYQESPIPHAAQAYDTVYIIADAVKRANSTSPDALKEALVKTAGLKLVTGEPKFGDRGDDIGKYLLITVIKGDKFELVKTVTAN